jgi:hypothetical protein
MAAPAAGALAAVLCGVGSCLGAQGSCAGCRRSSPSSRAATLSTSGERWDERREEQREKMVPRGGGWEERGRGGSADGGLSKVTGRPDEGGLVPHHRNMVYRLAAGVRHRPSLEPSRYLQPRPWANPASRPHTPPRHARGARGTARRKRLNLDGGPLGTHGGAEQSEDGGGGRVSGLFL